MRVDLLQDSIAFLSAALLQKKITALHWKFFAKAFQNHLAVTLLTASCCSNPMEKQFLFSHSCCVAQSSQVQERGLAVGQSWAAYLEISEAAIHRIPKCAHQLLAWKHVGSIKQGLFAAVAEVLITLLSLPWLHPGHRMALAVPGSGLHLQLQGQKDTTRESLCHPSASRVPDLSSCFHSAWKEPPFCTTFDCHVWLTLGRGLRISLPGDSQHNQ